MNPHGDGKNEPTDPEQLVRLLELQLAQQRVARKRAGAPFRNFRLASFIFLFAVIVGIALAFYYVFYSGGFDELRSRKGPEPSAAPSSAPP